MNWLKRLFCKRKVLVHTRTGDMMCEVRRGDIIDVPWCISTCPFHLEPNGSVTLRLMWGKDNPSKGYGMVWEGITWETQAENRNEV